jgi:hypothetical protein
LSQAPDNNNKEPEPEEEGKKSGDQPSPDEDGMSAAVEQFREKHKVRKKSLFRSLGRMGALGAAQGSSKAVGEHVTGSFIDEPPEWIQWFIENLL